MYYEIFGTKGRGRRRERERRRQDVATAISLRSRSAAKAMDALQVFMGEIGETVEHLLLRHIRSQILQHLVNRNRKALVRRASPPAYLGSIVM